MDGGEREGIDRKGAEAIYCTVCVNKNETKILISILLKEPIVVV